MIVMIPMDGANFGKFAKFHSICTGVELVKLEPRSGDYAKIVILVLDPDRAHNAISTRGFALNVE